MKKKFWYEIYKKVNVPTDIIIVSKETLEKFKEDYGFIYKLCFRGRYSNIRKSTKKWIEKANKDLEIVKKLYEENYYDYACYSSQQAVKK